MIVHLDYRYMTESIARQPTFCVSGNGSTPSFPAEQCMHTEPTSPNDVVELNGETPQDYYFTLTNVGLWFQVAYKFRIPILEGEEVSELTD